MPIYEFYCEDCNILFNFFSSRVNTEKRPLCPKCKEKILERHVSRFSFLKGAKTQDDVQMPAIDEKKLEKVMSLLKKEAKNLHGDDPGNAAHLMRKVFDTTGLNPGPGMEEALSRLEAGENPDKIEEEIGKIADREGLFRTSQKGIQKTGKKPPLRDETLYNL